MNLGQCATLPVHTGNVKMGPVIEINNTRAPHNVKEYAEDAQFLCLLPFILITDS